MLQAGVVGGVIHIALRLTEDNYQPAIDSVADSALMLCAVLASRRGQAALRLA